MSMQYPESGTGDSETDLDDRGLDPGWSRTTAADERLSQSAPGLQRHRDG